ncbi:hypothetical protein LEP1GSC060_2417 [Leptospira weilii serovar Ranarum str. ICFT]|uniref:Uncharacterized protein n=1 Tax=Leptospira weilii serovar Ranarum str. ICFT TaxID=1218598 RepID=N1WPZ9_9LEPT|nr:hypothetical protein LEP1GSC060_2417 [Leptospira weilii serovar Ranarum str. ICFT]
MEVISDRFYFRNVVILDFFFKSSFDFRLKRYNCGFRFGFKSLDIFHFLNSLESLGISIQ